MAKSRDAFRTISEVADWLDTPAHVLRFWESKFSQVKPIKRAGGRRYYRPADMELLGGIKRLLHDEGMTIKGVQKILREQGVKHVSSLSNPADPEDVIADAPFIEAPEDRETVVPFVAPEPPMDVAPEVAPVAQAEPETPPAEMAPDTPEPEPETAVPVAQDTGADHPISAEPEPTPAPEADTHSEPVPEPEPEPEPEIHVAQDTAAQPIAADAPSFVDDADQSPVPAFLKQPLAPAEQADVAAAPEPEPQAAAPTEPDPEPVVPAGTAPPRVIPDDPDLDAIAPRTGALTTLAHLAALDSVDAAALAPVVAQLRALQDRLDSTAR